jgi:Tfp pilus assembly protein PilN
MDWNKEYRVSDLFRRNAGADGGRDEPTAPSAPAAPPAGSETRVWKKEIKLSSLFRRRKQSAAKPQLALPAAGDTIVDAPAPPDSVPVATGEPDESSGAAGGPDAPTPGSDQDDQAVREAAAAAALSAAAANAGGDAAATSPSEAGAETEAGAEAEGETGPDGPGVASDEATEEAAAATAVGDSRRKRGLGRRAERGGPARASDRGAGRTSGALPEVPLMKALNLLPQDIKLPQTTVRPVVARVAVLAAAVLVAAGLAAFYLSERNQLDERAGQVEDLEIQLAELEALQAQDELAADDGSSLAGEALSRATALSAALDGRRAWDRLLRDVSLTLPEDVWFESIISTPPVASPQPTATTGESTPAVEVVQSTPETVTITGWAMSQDDVAQLLARLGVVPELRGVHLLSAVREELDETLVIRFEVVGSLKEPGQVQP